MIDIPQILAGLEKADVPFSFRIDSKPAELEFQHKRDKRRREGEAVYAYAVNGCPLTVVVETRHVPAHNLLTYRFRIRAEQNITQRISDVRIFDLTAPEATTLRGWNGGCAYNVETGKNEAREHFPPMLYRIWDRELVSQGPVHYEDLLGRSSVVLLPVWMLYNESGGLWAGPEWSGSWSMDAEAADGGAAMNIALPLLDFRMLQGEEVQLPPVSLGTYKGSVWDGCVAMRRTIHDEFLPTINGEKPLPPVLCHAIGGSLPQFDAEGLDNEINVCASIGVEQFVFASPWYRPPKGTKTPFSLEQLRKMHPNTESVERYELTAWWEQCGLYEPDPERFPRGIKTFAEECEARGVILGLWYDPRINVMTAPHESLRDGLLPYKKMAPNDEAWDMGLIDMGSASGREIMLELLERMVVEFGARFLWHDLNTHPRRRYWDLFEQEGRKGLAELRHYNGSDEVYDEFMARHPGVWIEWCGGGGTMVNLGVLRRSHTLHIADFCGIRDSEKPHSDPWRAMRTSLNWILPSVYINNHVSPPGGLPAGEGMGMHNYITTLGGAVNLHQTISHWSDRDRADAALAVSVFKNIRRYLHKDFWSLLPLPAEDDYAGWDGWQFHDPETDSGVLMLFKRRDCEDAGVTVRPRWPDDWRDLRYTAMLGEASAAAGPDGLTIEMPSRGAILRYDRAKGREGQAPRVGMTTTH
jgi:alpha-galactosidase